MHGVIAWLDTSRSGLPGLKRFTMTRTSGMPEGGCYPSSCEGPSLRMTGPSDA